MEIGWSAAGLARPGQSLDCRVPALFSVCGDLNSSQTGLLFNLSGLLMCPISNTDW